MLSSNECRHMIEGHILVTLNHPIDAGFKSPQFFLLVKDV